jgi:predicted GTPase
MSGTFTITSANGKHLITTRSSSFDVWLNALNNFKEQTSRLEGSTHTRVTEILNYLLDEQVTVTFGGHFKAGKSTVLNSLLGRQILPVNDLPETGAVCYLRASDRDQIRVLDKDGARMIACTTEAIEKEISLLSNVGERRNTIQVERLEIDLQEIPVPAKVQWVDSPGINDTEEMNERVMKAARQTDVLIWVLSSKQLFAEVEKRFLEKYIAENGTCAIVFLLNTFLRQDTQAEWDVAIARYLPRLNNRFAVFAQERGLQNGYVPRVFPVSGRAIGDSKQTGFGGEEIRRFLTDIDEPTHPRIQLSRIHRANRDLNEIADFLEKKIQQEKAKVVAWEDMRASQRQKAEQIQAAFARRVESLVNACIADLTTVFRERGRNLANTILGTNLLRDNSYGQKLTDWFNSTVTVEAQKLVRGVQGAAAHYELVRKRDFEQQLQGNLAPSRLTIIVPNNSLKGGTIATGAAGGAAVGSFVPMPVVATILGGLIGAAGALLKANTDSTNKDAAETREMILRETEKAVLSLSLKHHTVVALITDSYVSRLFESSLEHPDNSELKTLEWMFTWVTWFKDEVQHLV